MPALRDNNGKPEMSYLLDIPHALEALVAVFKQGAVKYSRGNWALGGKPDEEYLDAALRHLYKFRNEGVYDSDIGTQHIANAIWNLAALIELNYSDRPPIANGFDQDAFEARYSVPDRALTQPVIDAMQADPGSFKRITAQMIDHPRTLRSGKNIVDL